MNAELFVALVLFLDWCMCCWLVGPGSFVFFAGEDQLYLALYSGGVELFVLQDKCTGKAGLFMYWMA